MTYLRQLLFVPIVVLSLAGGTLAHEVGLNAIIQVQTASGETATYNATTLPRSATVTSVEVVAYYSTGEPMSDCQVTVLSPDDRSTPWRTGRCDRQGRYRFTPDVSKRGRWTVRVQSSGHSSFIDIPIL
ncbi:hypothetical protein IQ268_23665 [Oculatella sp. LEGE 06141]|uniref:hypothetical protein n=1 Tax=Oculatella sp. LEGE 06141 TaxID=1828648 RepID=UPI00187EB75B|nr:hypothetical protein [Oculatella sp. LEGE 06141]MBE9181565.1 hypothetical protein [Oculatella sp. LEGE 06141]